MADNTKRLREALVSLVGSGDPEELAKMRQLLGDAKNNGADIDVLGAIDALLATTEPAAAPAPSLQQRVMDAQDHATSAQPTKRYLAYMMAPMSPSNNHTTTHNIAVAKDWCRFLRELTADMPITITCPWLVGILLGDQDGDPAQRERGLVDCETTAARCDFTIAVGQTVTPSTGMRREIAACPGPWVDLLDLGMEYETPQRMGFDRREDIRDRIRQALREVPRLQLGQFRAGVTELAEADRKQLAELQRLRITTAQQADTIDEQREIIARLRSENRASAQLAEVQRGQLDQAALHLGAERQKRHEAEQELARVRAQLDPAALAIGTRERGVHPSSLTDVLTVADEERQVLTAHVRTLLGILDAIGGYMPSGYQAAIRAAREAVGRG